MGSPSLEGTRITVLGLARSGVAAAVLARRHGAAVTVFDEASGGELDERAAALSRRGIGVNLDWHQDRWHDGADLAIVSPGIGADSILTQLGANLGCPMVSEFEFGARFCACPILAVTGTNGKTTTVELTVHALRKAGKQVLGAGNIGLPMSEAAARSDALDVIVAEVSSFQLERTDRFSPLAAAWLNFSEDHLDRYRSAAAYLQAKLRLLRNLERPAQVILNEELMAIPAIATHPLWQAGRPTTVSLDPGKREARFVLTAAGELAWRPAGQRVSVLSRRSLRLMGDHNVENALFALALCEAAGVKPDAVAGAVASFAPSAHRQELVGVANGVRFVNDSKATNPDAMVQALKTVGGQNGTVPSIILIAGGRDKGLGFEAVMPYLRQRVRMACLVGEAAERLAARFRPVVPCRLFASLEAAVGAAGEDARSGDTVLLSPGCASQDMFKDYAERGDRFTQEVRRRFGE